MAFIYYLDIYFTHETKLDMAYFTLTSWVFAPPKKWLHSLYMVHWLKPPQLRSLNHNNLNATPGSEKLTDLVPVYMRPARCMLREFEVGLRSRS